MSGTPEGPPERPAPATADLPPLPGRVVVAAYVMALVTLLVPLAVIGAVFAGVVLVKRDRVPEGIGVILVGVACVALGMTVVWG